MQTTITWSGIAYNSIEHCVITRTPAGYEISSTINGTHDNKKYEVDYSMLVNLYWELEWMEIQAVVNGTATRKKVEKKNNGLLLQGKPGKMFTGAHDVDIALTPFTNTLPINRLGLIDGDQQVIEVMYFDILADEISPVTQVYTKLDFNRYIYSDQNFIETITVNEEGLVTDYPGLFTMTAAVVT